MCLCHRVLKCFLFLPLTATCIVCITCCYTAKPFINPKSIQKVKLLENECGNATLKIWLLGKSRQDNETLIFLLAQQFRNMMYGSGCECTLYHIIPSVVVSLKYDERAALPVSFTSGCYGHPHMLRRKERDSKEGKKKNRLIILGTKANVPGLDLSLPGAV